MLEPIIRIAARWLVLPFAVWLGLPQETVDAILADEDVRMVLTYILPVAVTVVEGWYLWAKTRGGST